MLNQVSRLTGKEIEKAQFEIARSMVFVPMGGNPADRPTRMSN